MHLRHSLSFLACLLFPPVLLFSGCGSFQKAKFNHGEGVGSDPILIVPFSEPKDQRWFGESERGRIVAEALKTWVSMNADANFPQGDPVDEALRVIRDRTEPIRLDDWKNITSELGVKYVLVGKIESFVLNRPNVIGILEPSVKASYKLINVETKKVAYERPSFTVDLLKDRETEALVVDFGGDPSTVEKRLLAKLGQQIGKDLYGYSSQ